ncbi:hypothetical protein BDR26DRAFT_940545 [Obelidium mucronatum]|nr:hypothetical protein BDR26DRAFT_940545 [Obelidium mucronatum]
MPAIRIIPVVKYYKTQKSEHGAIQLPTVAFDGTYDDLKTTLWDLAKTHIKGLGKVEGKVVSADQTEQTMDRISDFVVILKSSRSFTFGVYSRHILKAADYERVVASITGGRTAQDCSGAPNQQQFNDTVQQLQTLDAQILQSPPADITLLFERQTRTEQQLVQVRKSLGIALDVIKDQQSEINRLKRNLSAMVTDVTNQLSHRERNLKAHKRACQNVLDAVSPVETATAASEFSQIQNEQDLEHQQDSDLEDRVVGQRQQEEEEDSDEEESLQRRQPHIYLHDNDELDEMWSDPLDNLSQ